MKLEKWLKLLFMMLVFSGIILIKTATTEGATFLTPGDYKRNYQFDGRTRSYGVHIPLILKNQTNVPVILAFHGGGSNSKIMKLSTELAALSDKEGFVVVYPNGTGPGGRLLTWNSGRCCAWAKRKNINDVGAISELLDQLTRIVPYDKKRVYATGISNGAMICYRLACELSDKIAAIAPVAGPLEISPCTPKRPVPVIHFHGTKDRNVPYQGGVGDRSITKTDYHSVKYTIDKWKAINGCSETSTKKDFTDKTNDGTTVSSETWNNCAKGSAVALITIKNGGHTWPGSPLKKWGKLGLGKVCHDISAAKIMWEFFKKHPKP